MKRVRLAQYIAAFVAAAGLCTGQMAFAAVAAPAPPISDVRLQEGGVLIGQVVTPQNVVLPGADVALFSGQQKMAVARTDDNGYFAFRGLKNGVYHLAAKENWKTFRVWTKETAPPVAQPGALVVAGDETVLGQREFPTGRQTVTRIRNFLTNPLVVAGLVATAVAVPVAIHNADRDRASP